MKFSSTDPCDQCEEMLQPFLDRELTAVERARPSEHLDGCECCRRAATALRWILRRFVRQARRRGDAARAQAEARRP